MKKIFLLLVIVAGIYWIIGAIEYGLWVRKGPGGGFMPLVAGVAAVLFAVQTLITERNAKVQKELLSWHAVLPIAALIGIVLGAYVIGLILSIALFVVLWLKVVEKHGTKFSVITGFTCAGVLYAVFGAWLQVPLPLGLFEHLL